MEGRLYKPLTTLSFLFKGNEFKTDNIFRTTVLIYYRYTVHGSVTRCLTFWKGWIDQFRKRYIECIGITTFHSYNLTDSPRRVMTKWNNFPLCVTTGILVSLTCYYEHSAFHSAYAVCITREKNIFWPVYLFTDKLVGLLKTVLWKYRFLRKKVMEDQLIEIL